MCHLPSDLVVYSQNDSRVIGQADLACRTNNRRPSEDEIPISDRLIREKGESPEEYNTRVKAEVNKVVVDNENTPTPISAPVAT